MRLLFCCEFYFPSVGGVQEVMRQIAERMVMRGHQVTVATTPLTDRNFSELNGVKVVEFAVTGNQARGIKGEVKRYQDFVVEFPCDGLLIKAAQQWTFDALLPVLDRINARKVFIPCGFSGLYEPAFALYFQDLPAILCRFDHLIFYAEHYRDIDFARAHGIGHFSVVPNGASELEFNVEPDPAFRARHAIPEDSFVLLTVGTLTGVKGHREIAEAFARMHTRGQHVTWIMNGNPPPGQRWTRHRRRRLRRPLPAHRRCPWRPAHAACLPGPVVASCALLVWLTAVSASCGVRGWPAYGSACWL